MKINFILLINLYTISIVSCRQSINKQLLNEQTCKCTTDVKNYTGNAFIFNDPEIYRARCFIIPIKESDSMKFKNINVEEAIKGRVSIQMFFGHLDLLKLINDKSKEMIKYKACNLPKDSMFFSRVFISYKNCIEMKNNDYKENNADSCNSKLVERTDSTQFIFHIYN